MNDQEESLSLAFGVVLELYVDMCMKVTMPDGVYFWAVQDGGPVSLPGKFL